MKFIPFTFFIVLISVTQSFSQMKFQHGDWGELLEKAKSQGKIIFVDAYADWCGPCKMMDRDVFSDESVGEFFNTTFVNVKMDMEKGEGPGLAQLYNVRAYPTFLFIDGDGNLVHRGIGYQPAETFLALGAAAMDTENSIGSQERKFKRGDRDPEFLYNFAKAKIDMMDGSHTKIVEAYLDTQEDWTTEQSMELIFYAVEDVDSKMFEFFKDNKTSFENMFGVDYMEQKVQDIAVKNAYVGEAAPNFEQVENIIQQFYPALAQKTSAQMKINYYNASGDAPNFAQSVVDYFQKYPSDDYQELNSYAWAFYLSVDDKKMLKEAVKWAQQSVGLSAEYFNLDTLAALYAKLGKKGKAKKYGNKAIAMAKETGEDYSETQKLLDSL